MSYTTQEREIPGIVPADRNNYAHISRKELHKAKKPLPEPITVHIFGGPINDKPLEIPSEKQEKP
jgi:hypothetical protein